VADPGDAQPVLAYLQGERLQLDTILVTPHGPEHIGGDDASSGAAGARLCRTHEYTLSSLKFARKAEPGNLKLINYRRRCEEPRDPNLLTLLSTTGQARETSTHSCARAVRP